MFVVKFEDYTVASRDIWNLVFSKGTGTSPKQYLLPSAVKKNSFFFYLVMFVVFPIQLTRPLH